jgi:hypothetical protein
LCHEICRYLPAAKVQVDEGATAAPLDRSVLAPEPLELSASAFSTRERGAGFLSDPPRLRLHLLHQILLV